MVKSASLSRRGNGRITATTGDVRFYLQSKTVLSLSLSTFLGITTRIGLVASAITRLHSCQLLLAESPERQVY